MTQSNKKLKSSSNVAEGLQHSKGVRRRRPATLEGQSLSVMVDSKGKTHGRLRADRDYHGMRIKVEWNRKCFNKMKEPMVVPWSQFLKNKLSRNGLGINLYGVSSKYFILEATDIVKLKSNVRKSSMKYFQDIEKCDRDCNRKIKWYGKGHTKREEIREDYNKRREEKKKREEKEGMKKEVMKFKCRAKYNEEDRKWYNTKLKEIHIGYVLEEVKIDFNDDFEMELERLEKTHNEVKLNEFKKSYFLTEEEKEKYLYSNIEKGY